MAKVEGLRGQGGSTEVEVRRAAEAFERDTDRPPSDIAGDDPVFVELFLILAGYLPEGEQPPNP